MEGNLLINLMKLLTAVIIVILLHSKSRRTHTKHINSVIQWTTRKNKITVHCNAIWYKFVCLFVCQVLISLSVFCELLTHRELDRLSDMDCPWLFSGVTGMLYAQQVFGGGVQENPLFPVARKPDSLQSRLLILCYMENHAKFQVCRHCTNNLPE